MQESCAFAVAAKEAEAEAQRQAAETFSASLKAAEVPVCFLPSQRRLSPILPSVGAGQGFEELVCGLQDKVVGLENALADFKEETELKSMALSTNLKEQEKLYWVEKDRLKKLQDEFAEVRESVALGTTTAFAVDNNSVLFCSNMRIWEGGMPRRLSTCSLRYDEHHCRYAACKFLGGRIRLALHAADSYTPTGRPISA